MIEYVQYLLHIGVACIYFSLRPSARLCTLHCPGVSVQVLFWKRFRARRHWQAWTLDRSLLSFLLSPVVTITFECAQILFHPLQICCGCNENMSSHYAIIKEG